MLGDKLYLLRKNRNISQEELAEILNTSRQAVSKWERNETYPDIDKLILMGKIFNVSIDYLLDHELIYKDVDEFIEKLKDCYKNSNFTININDIKLWCLKHPNNFKLHLHSSEYLFLAYIDNNDDEYLKLSQSLISKAIEQYIPEYSHIVSLNDLHSVLAEIYLMQEEYELAVEYIEKNNVYGCELLLAKCNLYLKKYEDALEISSDIYLKSISNIMNISYVEIMVLLNSQKIEEAYNLTNWAISFIDSIINNDFSKKALCPFIYLKATCEHLLKINNEKSIEILKEISTSTLEQNVVTESGCIRYYFGKTDPLLLFESNTQNVLKDIINRTSKKDLIYKTLNDIYNEIFKGGINE